jgi:hypothetical protein
MGEGNTDELLFMIGKQVMKKGELLRARLLNALDN